MRIGLALAILIGIALPAAAADYTTCTPRGDSYLYHPQHYVDFLKSLKDDPSLILAAAIVGNPTPFGVANRLASRS